MNVFFKKFSDKVYKHLIEPIIESVSPIQQASVGAAIGMFVGMTPTVGIQMWVVFMIWLFCKYLLRFKFDLIIGTALVWISNPLTMFFLYYGFLVTGQSFFTWINVETMDITYSAFETRLGAIVNNPDTGSLDKMIEGVNFLIIDLGSPMVFGSLFYALPLSIITYLVTFKYLHLYRVSKAKKACMDYVDWKKKYERP